MPDEDPCFRTQDADPKTGENEWWCVNDHTGCLWNDGNNTCTHEGLSHEPLEEEDAPED